MQAITPPVVSVPDAILLEFLADAPANADRIYRAKALVEAGHVERSNFPGLWLVRSGNPATPNDCYRVANGLCHCPDTARVGATNCKHSIGCRIFRAMERMEVDQEQAAPTPPPCPCFCHVGLRVPCDCCDQRAPLPTFAEQADAPLDPDAPLGLELSGKGYLTLVLTAALPAPLPPVGITRIPLSPEMQAISDELFGPEDAA